MNSLIQKTTALAFACLWFAVSGFQIFHTWNHHHSCHHHSHVTHEHKDEHACHDGPSQLACRQLQGPAFQLVHECLICDWDWAPTKDLDVNLVVLETPDWDELLKVGKTRAGFTSSQFDNAQTRRGPPNQG
jgi:hypothetical protein